MACKIIRPIVVCTNHGGLLQGQESRIQSSFFSDSDWKSRLIQICDHNTAENTDNRLETIVFDKTTFSSIAVFLESKIITISNGDKISATPQRLTHMCFSTHSGPEIVVYARFVKTSGNITTIDMSSSTTSDSSKASAAPPRPRPYMNLNRLQAGKSCTLPKTSSDLATLYITTPDSCKAGVISQRPHRR